MKPIAATGLLIAFITAIVPLAVAQTTPEPMPKDEKPTEKTEEKPVLETVDSSNRPEGAINDQTARIYVWHGNDAWHVRTTAKNTRTFTGTIRVKDAKIMSCVSVGLKTDKNQKTNPDVWEVNAARDELRFTFHTGRLSDGFDLVVKGDDGQITFDMQIDGHIAPHDIFIGRVRKHPSKAIFTYLANPKVTVEKINTVPAAPIAKP
jgi:hypothetical protein